jgi:hypothetical protein
MTRMVNEECAFFFVAAEPRRTPEQEPLAAAAAPDCGSAWCEAPRQRVQRALQKRTKHLHC